MIDHKFFSCQDIQCVVNIIELEPCAYLQVDDQIQKAFELWAASTNLNFQAKSKGSVHIEIRFERKESGVLLEHIATSWQYKGPLLFFPT